MLCVVLPPLICILAFLNESASFFAMLTHKDLFCSPLVSIRLIQSLAESDISTVVYTFVWMSKSKFPPSGSNIYSLSARIIASFCFCVTLIVCEAVPAASSILSAGCGDGAGSVFPSTLSAKRGCFLEEKLLEKRICREGDKQKWKDF